MVEKFIRHEQVRQKYLDTFTRLFGYEGSMECIDGLVRCKTWPFVKKDNLTCPLFINIDEQAIEYSEGYNAFDIFYALERLRIGFYSSDNIEFYAKDNEASFLDPVDGLFFKTAVADFMAEWLYYNSLTEEDADYHVDPSNTIFYRPVNENDISYKVYRKILLDLASTLKLDVPHIPTNLCKMLTKRMQNGDTKLDQMVDKKAKSKDYLKTIESFLDNYATTDYLRSRVSEGDLVVDGQAVNKVDARTLKIAEKDIEWAELMLREMSNKAGKHKGSNEEASALKK